MDILSTPIDFLKGVGPMRADVLRKELNIFTYNDLLHYFPFRYIDRSKIYRISDIDRNMQFIQIKGVAKKIESIGKGRSRRLSVCLEDSSGSINLVWFKGIKWIQRRLQLNTEYLVFGKPSIFKML